MQRIVLAAVEAEFLRYKNLAERVFEQLEDRELAKPPGESSLSIATMAWHVAGNLESRFTDFGSSDGEKPWRRREDEFSERRVARAALMERWESGWAALTGALGALSDGDLDRRVPIRGVELTIAHALSRSLAHAAYHVGQMVYVGKLMRGADWTYLSIPPGKTDEYNRRPTKESG